MNAIIKINGADVTDSCLLSATRIAFDSTKRITTASISVMGQALNSAAQAFYDSAHYDTAKYSVALREMYEVQILDGRDGTTKLFDGQIYAMTLQQSDTPGFSVFYQCDMNDWAAWLDRSVCWDSSFALTMPNSDQGIIQALLGHFCPRIHLTDIAQIVPVIQKFDWATKTCRQVLDDLSTLSMGAWRVDFDANLHYFLASAAPAAPFGLSTSPDYSTTYPVRVDGYKHDFTNPVNRSYVRGNLDPATGVAISATYSDPVSVGQYGEYATGVVDPQIVTGWDAALKAKSAVLANAYPIETGNFTIWGPDGLQCGMQVHIVEENIGIDGNYTIRALTMQWVDQNQVVYTAQFGATQPNLETILRLLDQRTKWQTSVTAATGPPPPGSVTDASIAPPGLSASSIQSVNAGTIVGKITANQIQTVNASSIVGAIDASNITAVNAGSIQGFIGANQIGSVNATTIQGVVVSSQLADQIIDNLAKYADVLRPIRMVKNGDPWPPTLPDKNFPANSFFYYQPSGHIYQITANGLSWTLNDNPSAVQMSFYYIGAINAASITGLIAAGQIGTITAGQITGQIAASQIAGVNASVIAGQIQATQIQTVNATAIQGTLSAAQIGTISAGQIGSINAATITIGQLQDTQIAGMSGAKLSVGTVTSDKFNGYSIDVGGLANLPGRIRVLNGAGTVVAQLGYMTEVGLGVVGGGWFKTWAAGGTSYSDAPIYTDTGGNLTIRNPAMTNPSLSNPTINISGNIYSSPTTFDATYGSLAWVNEQAPDKASFVSRGLVLYYNGARIGGVVRSPSGGWMEAEFTVGGSYVLISGNAGVRSDQGYKVGSTQVINSSSQFVGNGINMPSQTITCGPLNSGALVVSGGATMSGTVTAAQFAVTGQGTSGWETVGPMNLSSGGVIYLYFKGGIYYGHSN